MHKRLFCWETKNLSTKKVASKVDKRIRSQTIPAIAAADEALSAKAALVAAEAEEIEFIVGCHKTSR